MTAAVYNLVIDQGSDFAIEFTVNESGSVKDLTGYSARAQLRPTKSSSALTATFLCSIPTPANGKIFRGKWKTVQNEICYKQSSWSDYKCVLVYVGFNDGMKLYFVQKVGKGSVYVAGIIYEEIY